MALTHHSVRTCFLWKETPLFGDASRQRLWASLLACLEKLQNPRHARGTTNAADTAGTVDESVRTFLSELLVQASDPTVAAELRSGLRGSRPIELLWEWHTSEAVDDGAEPHNAAVFNGETTRATVRRLFTSELTQAFAAYSLGQLAFLFGHLWLAK